MPGTPSSHLEPCPLQSLLASQGHPLGTPWAPPTSSYYTWRSPEPRSFLPPGAMPSEALPHSLPSALLRGEQVPPTAFPQPLGSSFCQPAFSQQMSSLNKTEALLCTRSCARGRGREGGICE